LLSLCFAALIIASLRREGWHAILLAAAGGFCAGAAMFVSFTSIVAVGAWGLAIALGVGREPSGHARRIAAAAFAGFVAALAIPAALGMNWLEVFHECMAGAHRIQVLILGRQYSTWVAWNLVDYALFLGPALAIAVAAAAFDEARVLTSRNEIAALLFENRASFPFALAMFVVLLLLDLSGKILGETGRIWMFLMPLAVLGVAVPHRLAQRYLVTLAIAQFLFLLTLRMTWNVPG